MGRNNRRTALFLALLPLFAKPILPRCNRRYGMAGSG
jgi:hypothetical protein